MRSFKRFMSFCLIVALVIISVPMTSENVYATTKNYHYDKYSIGYQLGGWSNTTYVAFATYSDNPTTGTNQATYSGYSVSSNGAVTGTGQSMKHYTSMSGYVIEGSNTVYDVQAGSISDEFVEFSNYTEHRFTYNARKATTQQVKTFVQNIVAPEGTYPENGLHSDGYFYIKRQEENLKPTLTVSTADNQLIDNGGSFLVSGEMNDANFGTSVNLKYTIKQSGQVISGHNNVNLHSITSNGTNQAFNDLSISLAGISNGQYTIELSASDQLNLKSDVVTLSFEIVAPNQAPVLTLSSTADLTITEGETVAVSGNVLDSNVGTDISLKYSLYQSGNVVSGHNAVELEAFTATGSDQVITTGSVDVSAVAGGDYVLKVWAEDQRSAKSSEISINLRIDAKSPVPELYISNDNDQIILKGQSYQIDGEVKGVDSGDTVSVKYTLKKSGSIVTGHENQDIHSVTADGTKQGFSHTLSLSDLSVGSYTIELQAVDQNSFVSTVQTEAFTIYAKPELTLTSSIQQSVFANENIVISANVLDYDSGEVVTTRYSAYNNSGSPISTHQNIQVNEYTSTGSSQSISNYNILMNGTFPVGDYYLLVKSTDAAGHESSVKRIDFSVVEKTFTYEKYQLNYSLSGWTNFTYSTHATYSDNPTTGYWHDVYKNYSITSSGTIQGSSYEKQDYQKLDGYEISGNEIIQILPGYTSYVFVEFSNYTENRLTYNAKKASVVESKQLINSFVSVEGIYPDNGKHSDGYWYIKRDATNLTPMITITTTDNKVINLGQNLTIEGSYRDQNNGDNIEVKYTIKKDGTDLAGHINSTLLSATSNGNQNPINQQIDLTGLEVGDYSILLWITDDNGAESAKVTRNFNIFSQDYQPNLAITNLDLQELSIGDPLQIQGTISDQNINDQYFVQYSVFDTDNNVIAGYENLQLTSGDSTQANQSLSETLNLDALGAGSYSIKLQAKDSTDLLSESYTINFTLTDNFNQLNYSIRANKNAYVIIDGSSVKGTVNKKITITYPVDAVALLDVNAMTAQEDILVGNVQNSNIEILENDAVAGKLVIKINETISAGKEWTGSFSIIKYKGLLDKDIKIKYTVEDI